MPLFEVKPLSETKRLLACTEQEAQRNLESAARRLLKEARWHPYGAKIRELQKPLLQVRMARRRVGHAENADIDKLRAENERLRSEIEKTIHVLRTGATQHQVDTCLCRALEAR